MNKLDISKITLQMPKLLNQVEEQDDVFTIYELTQELQAAHRSLKFSKDCELKDVFTNHWMLWIGNPPQKSVYLKNRGQWIELTGPCAIFIPPFSLLQWKVNAGEYEWVGFSWEVDTKELPENAFAFSWDFKNRISSLYELKKIISSADVKIEVYHEDFSSAVSTKIKKYMDKNYKSSIKLEDISKQVKIPHSTLTHYFQKSFGLSPVEYRKRLRTAESLRLMIGNKQNTHQAFRNTGFEDYSRFYRNIKSTYGTSPNKFTSK